MEIVHTLVLLLSSSKFLRFSFTSLLKLFSCFLSKGQECGSPSKFNVGQTGSSRKIGLLSLQKKMCWINFKLWHFLANWHWMTYLVKDSNLMYGSFNTFIFKSLLALTCFARLIFDDSLSDDLQVCLSSQACNFSVVQMGIPQVWALLSGSTVHCCGCVRARSNIASTRDFCKRQQFSN